MEPNSPLTALISGAFGVVSTIIAFYLQKRVQHRRRPKDRIEVIFDGYDSIIAQLRELNDAQTVQLQSAAKENERLHGVITDLQLQMRTQNGQITQLETQLKALRDVKLEA